MKDSGRGGGLPAINRLRFDSGLPLTKAQRIASGHFFALTSPVVFRGKLPAGTNGRGASFRELTSQFSRQEA